MFGDNLKSLLKSLKKTQYVASKELGVSQPCLNLWLCNKRNPDLKDILNICHTFNTTPNYLMGFEDDITPQDRAILGVIKAATIPQQHVSTEDKKHEGEQIRHVSGNLATTKNE